MEIKIVNQEIKNKWDYQKAQLLLKWQGIDSSIEDLERKRLEKEVTLYMWGEIKKYFPNIEKHCTGKSKGFNKLEERNFNTPIICIHGSFYMQYIKENHSHEWSWNSIDLEAYRFNFNENGYFKGLLETAEKQAKQEGYSMNGLSKECKHSKD